MAQLSPCSHILCHKMSYSVIFFLSFADKKRQVLDEKKVYTEISFNYPQILTLSHGVQGSMTSVVNFFVFLRLLFFALLLLYMT